MKISVIISTYHRHDTLKSVLLAMKSQTHMPNEIIVIDQTPKKNIPKDFYVDFEKELPIKIIQGVKPSMTVSRNHGIMVSKYEVLLIIDDDIVINCKGVIYNI